MSLIAQVEHPVDKMTEFVRPYFNRFDGEDVKEVVLKHWLYGTIDAVYKEGEIIACVRWNVSSGGLIFDILDYVVKEGEDGARLARHLIARNWHRFPSVKVIRFARDRKYPGRSPRVYSIHHLLHLKEKPYGK